MKTVKKVAAGFFLSIGFICLMIPVSVVFDKNRTDDDLSAALGGLMFGVPATGLGTWLIWSLKQQHQQQKTIHLRSTFFRVIKQEKGKITPLTLAMEAQISGEEAKAYLDQLAQEFNADFDVSAHGDVIYHFDVEIAD